MPSHFRAFFMEVEMYVSEIIFSEFSNRQTTRFSDRKLIKLTESFYYQLV